MQAIWEEDEPPPTTTLSIKELEPQYCLQNTRNLSKIAKIVKVLEFLQSRKMQYSNLTSDAMDLTMAPTLQAYMVRTFLLSGILKSGRHNRIYTSSKIKSNFEAN